MVQRGRSREALSIVRASFERQPRVGKFQACYAYLVYLVLEPAEAVDALREMHRLTGSPTIPALAYSYPLLRKLGRPDEASIVLKHWLARGRTSPYAERLIDALVAEERFAEAEALARELLSGKPAAQGATRSLGGILLRQRRWGDAVATFSALVKEVPQSGNAQAFLGLALLGTGDGRGAEVHLSRARRLMSDHPERFTKTLSFKAFILEIQGDDLLAAETWEEAEREGLADGHAFLHLAIVRWRVNDLPAARRAIEKAAEVGLSEVPCASVSAVLAADERDIQEATRLLAVVASGSERQQLFPEAYVRCSLNLSGALEALERAVDGTPEDRDLERVFGMPSPQGVTWGELLVADEAVG